MANDQWCDQSYTLADYTPPTWASHLKCIPEKRIRLAQLPTPIHKWEIPELPQGFNVFIKRDDLTGCSLSGNKIRKLEFSLADALQKGCTDIITTGDLQSNQCRTTTVAARQLGLQSHLVIKSNIKNIKDVPCSGNLFLSRLCGAKIYICNTSEPYGEEIKQKITKIAASIRKETGHKPYIMPRGGSSIESVFGYITAYNEMIKQGVLNNITDIVLPCGSSGSAASLAIANHIVAGDDIRVHGFRIANFDASYTFDHIDYYLKALGMNDVDAKDILQFHEGYIGEGYAQASKKQLEFMKNVSLYTGIVLDPTYTGKCAYGMFMEMKHNPGVFKGNRVLFIHTGGIFGNFIDAMNKVMREPGSAANRSICDD